MSQIKLIPYLVQTKDEILLEKMRDAQADLLKAEYIPDHLKMALFEDLFLRIERFKEQMEKKKRDRKNDEISVDQAVQAQDGDFEEDYVVDEGDQEQVDEGAGVDEVYDEALTPPRQTQRRQRRRATHDVSLVENMSPSHTRTGTHFANASLEPNRVLQRKADWTVQNQPRWKN